MSTASTEPASSAADLELPEGTEIGEYRIERAIGKGGFGTVYRAHHPVIGKQVAIKVLARRYSADPSVVSRFVAEAKAVNQIRHASIIDIFSFGQLGDGRHYYVMELLDGEPLDKVLARHGPMALAQALPILRALARALDAAHAKGIAHRDLKPENVFLARESDGTEYPKLLDFGIAKLLAPDEDVRHRTGTGVPIGTPYYMSPEQCRGRDVDHRTDVYSFGILAYRMLTGKFPFTGDFMELMMKQIGEQAAPPSTHVPELPAAVDAAIAWMMQKDASARPAKLLDAVQALARPSPPRDSALGLAATTIAAPRSRARWLVPAALVLAAGGATAFYLHSRTDTPLAAPAAVPAPPRVAVPVPVPVPAPAAVPVPVPVPVPAPAPAPAALPPPAPPPPKHRAPPPPPPPADDGDVIHMSHDEFEKRGR